MTISKITLQQINPQAIEACRILHTAGHQAYLVGGCVRDLVLGETPKDFDICTDASPQKVMSLFPKTYPTGIKHGTITVAMENNQFEITTFRIDGSYTDGRRPSEVFFVMDIEQDLSRRDLTINAMAYDPIQETIVDPFGGFDDLQSAKIKAVGAPELRFQEDGLRIMRVARFASRFGYLVEENTFKAMELSSNTLKKVSKERIKDELCKILMETNSAYGLLLLEQSKILNIICPILTSHSISPNLEKCQGELETRIAFLYNNLPIKSVHKELLSLRFSNKEIKKSLFLLELLNRYQIFNQKQTALAYKSFMAVLKNHSLEPWELTLKQFIILTEALGLGSEKLFDNFKEELVFTKAELQINGEDLMSIGIPAGPEIKRILDNCYLDILRHPKNNNKSYLLKYAMGKLFN